MYTVPSGGSKVEYKKKKKKTNPEKIIQNQFRSFGINLDNIDQNSYDSPHHYLHNV